MGTYLGCPMEIDGRSTRKLEFILDRLIAKISSRKFCYLCQAGKLVLINLVLITLASYIMSVYHISKKDLGKITSICLKFWWARSMDKRPIYWKRKEVLFKYKAERGIGLRNLFHLNQALMF